MSKREETALSVFVWAGAAVALLAALLLSPGTALAIGASVGASGITLGVIADRRSRTATSRPDPLSAADSATLEHDRAA